MPASARLASRAAGVNATHELTTLSDVAYAPGSTLQERTICFRWQLLAASLAVNFGAASRRLSLRHYHEPETSCMKKPAVSVAKYLRFLPRLSMLTDFAGHYRDFMIFARHTYQRACLATLATAGPAPLRSLPRRRPRFRHYLSLMPHARRRLRFSNFS